MVLLTMFTSKILQISKFHPQTSTHQPLLVKMSKSDVSVPSNDTGVELKEHLQVERCKGGFLLLRVFESVLERYPTAAI